MSGLFSLFGKKAAVTIYDTIAGNWSVKATKFDFSGNPEPLTDVYTLSLQGSFPKLEGTLYGEDEDGILAPIKSVEFEEKEDNNSSFTIKTGNPENDLDDAGSVLFKPDDFWTGIGTYQNLEFTVNRFNELTFSIETFNKESQEVIQYILTKPQQKNPQSMLMSFLPQLIMMAVMVMSSRRQAQQQQDQGNAPAQ